MPGDIPEDEKRQAKVNIPEGVSIELEFINLFIPDVILQLVQKDSNDSAQQNRDKWKTPPISLTVSLIRQFLITSLYMSIVKTPNIAFHFNSSHTMSESTYLSDIGMTYVKFFTISRALHMNLEYIENIVDFIFKKYYTSSSFLSVDEGLLRFLGRYVWKVHIPNKPAGEGIKYFTMACACTGYLYSFFMCKKFKQMIWKIKTILKFMGRPVQKI